MLLIGFGHYCLEIVEYVICLPAELLQPFVGGGVLQMCEGTEKLPMGEMIKMFLKSTSQLRDTFVNMLLNSGTLRKKSKMRGRKVKSYSFFPPVRREYPCQHGYYFPCYLP